MSKSGMYGILRKSELMRPEFFRILTEEDELKTEEKWSVKASP
jgi:hypothetical protein